MSYLKSALCSISYLLSIPRLFGPFGKERVIVLMYHGITDFPVTPLKDIDGYNVPLPLFRKHMQYLSKQCNVISASDALAGNALSRSKKNVVITFDDGYRNNFTNAFPVLSQYSLPALFSLPSKFILERTPLWNNVIEHVAAASGRKTVHLRWNEIVLDMPIATLDEKRIFIIKTLSICNDLIQKERGRFIRHMLNELAVSADDREVTAEPDYAPLSLEDIREMSGSGLAEFASHSAHHYALSGLNEPDLKDELISSKSDIEEMTGMPCRYICIPGGHYNDTVIKNIFEAGYENIFTSVKEEFMPEEHGRIIGRNCIFRRTEMPSFADIVEGPFYRLTTLRR